jgi:hypothetical protein
MEDSTTQPDNEKQYSFHLLLLVPNPRTVVLHQDLLADKHPALSRFFSTSFVRRPVSQYLKKGLVDWQNYICVIF